MFSLLKKYLYVSQRAILKLKQKILLEKNVILVILRIIVLSMFIDFELILENYAIHFFCLDAFVVNST